MIRHDQFLQDIAALESMYRAFGGLRTDGIPKNRQWYAILAEGSIDQIRQAQAEMHEYLGLPYPVPDGPLPPDGDTPPHLSRAEDFWLALEQLCRLYGALGSLYAELHQFRPRLFAALAERMLPDLQATQAALNAYLEQDAIEETLAIMERPSALTNQTAPMAPTATPMPVPEEKA